MTTATETRPDTEQETVVFRSRDPRQVLTVRGAPTIDNGRGGRKVQTFEEFIDEQKRANVRREETGAEPLPIDDMPWKIQFEHNTFETSDPRVIEFLRSHDKFNAAGAPSSFVEEAPAPPDPLDQMTDPMKLITRASVERNRDQLEAIREVEQERDTPRPGIIEAVDTALEMIPEEPSESEAAAETEKGDPGGSDSANRPA